MRDIGGRFRPDPHCPHPHQCELADWCGQACNASYRKWQEQLQPLVVEIRPDASIEDYIALKEALKAFTVVSGVVEPSHNLPIVARHKRNDTDG